MTMWPNEKIRNNVLTPTSDPGTRPERRRGIQRKQVRRVIRPNVRVPAQRKG